MPPVSRQPWLYLQVRDHYANLIASGELAPGDPLPTEREIAAAHHVSPQTAVRAIELLRSDGLITTVPNTGSFVAEPRLIPGPQQQLAGITFPASHRIDVTAAELIPAPASVAVILGLLETRARFWPVIHREQVHYGAGGEPFMLAVSWFPPELAEPVPELTARQPLFGAVSAAHLIGIRTREAGAQRLVTHGKESREARPILDDGREGPLLGLDPGTVVLAEVYWWADDDGMLEYSEYVLRQGLVTENEYAV